MMGKKKGAHIHHIKSSLSRPGEKDLGADGSSFEVRDRGGSREKKRQSNQKKDQNQLKKLEIGNAITSRF